MGSILHRYIFRQIAFATLAVAVVLLVVMAGGTFARVLQQVANGSYPASVMFDVLGLKMLAALAALLPLALFLGTLVGLGRLHQSSELQVLAASGMGRRGLLQPAAMLAIPVAILIALVSLWLGPWAQRTSTTLIDQANHSVIAAGLEAGRFTALPGQGGIIFVSGMNRTGTRLDKVFIARQQPAQAGQPPVIRVVTAKSGRLFPGSDGTGRYLALHDGWQFEIPLGANNWKRMQYQENDASLAPASDSGGSGVGDIDAVATFGLLQRSGSQARAELAWRIAAPVAALVLALLALPLSRQSPREPRYGRLLIAVLAYFLYFSLLSLARNLIAEAKVPDASLIWSLQALVVVVAGWFLWRQYAPWKTPGVRAS